MPDATQGRIAEPNITEEDAVEGDTAEHKTGEHDTATALALRAQASDADDDDDDAADVIEAVAPANASAHRAPRAKPNKLTFTQANLKTLHCPPGKDRELYWDAGMKHFGLRVSSQGTRSFFVSTRVGGRKRQVRQDVGQQGDLLTLRDAHRLGEEILLALHKGHDPRSAKAALHDEAHTITLSQVWVLMEPTNLGDDRGERAASTKENYAYMIDHYLAELKDMPVASITKSLCEQVFKKISQRAKVAANNAMNHLQALLEFARNYFLDDQGQYRILPCNPVQLMRKTVKRNPVKARNRRILVESVRKVYQAFKLAGRTGHTKVARASADCLRLCLLMGPRRKQCSCLRFSHLDFDNGVITMPGEFTKNRQPWVRPMTTAVRELLMHRRALFLAEHDGAPPEDGWVFPSSRSKSGHIQSSQRTLKQGVRAASGKYFGQHDFRRTLEDLMVELDIDDSLRYRILDHIKDTHNKHYGNNPLVLRKALERIGEYLESEEAQPVDEAAPSAKAVPPQVTAQQQRRDWVELTRAELEALMYEMPGVRVARYFGVTETAVRRRCKRLGLPQFGRGYWGKVAAGKIDRILPKSKANPDAAQPDAAQPDTTARRPGARRSAAMRPAQALMEAHRASLRATPAGMKDAAHGTPDTVAQNHAVPPVGDGMSPRRRRARKAIATPVSAPHAATTPALTETTALTKESATKAATPPATAVKSTSSKPSNTKAHVSEVRASKPCAP